MILAEKIFSPELCRRIEAEIEQAEMHTSGELVVHVENTCPGEVFHHAVRVFETLGLHHTELRNAVLIYISVADHKLAILGDSGIHRFIQPSGWDDLVNKLGQSFKAGHFEQGLSQVIGEIGTRLGQHFPRMYHDQNEISNKVSFG